MRSPSAWPRRSADALVPVDEVGAAIGAHVGPGMVSVTVTPRE